MAFFVCSSNVPVRTFIKKWIERDAVRQNHLLQGKHVRAMSEALSGSGLADILGHWVLNHLLF